MTDYNSYEIVDILLVLDDCRSNFRRAAALYHQRFPRRKHPMLMLITVTFELTRKILNGNELHIVF